MFCLLVIHTRSGDVSVLAARNFSQSRFTPTAFGRGDTAERSGNQNKKDLFKFKLNLWKKTCMLQFSTSFSCPTHTHLRLESSSSCSAELCFPFVRPSNTTNHMVTNTDFLPPVFFRKSNICNAVIHPVLTSFCGRRREFVCLTF